MRKRSKYRPRQIEPDTMAAVMHRVATVTSHKDYLTTLRIKNHDALLQLTRGLAGRREIDTLIQAFNITEALYRRGFGTDYKLVVQAGQVSLKAVAARGLEHGLFIAKGPEINALNSMMALHDAQLDVISVLDLEQAVVDVRREYQAGKMHPIK